MGKGSGDANDRCSIPLASDGSAPKINWRSYRRKVQAASLALASGDALGFPTETVRHQWQLKKRFKLQSVEEFVDHQFGDKGEYSDDTQQTLMVARCIRPDGTFDIDRWSKLELPLWWQYQRGAGYTSSVAVQALRDGATWDNNFFDKTIPDRHGNPRHIVYRNADSNGTVMRVAPLAMANPHRPTLMKENVWLSAVTTHGHPGAALAALLHGETVRQLLVGEMKDLDEIPARMESFLLQQELPGSAKFDTWRDNWGEAGLQQRFDEGQAELLAGLRLLQECDDLEVILQELGVDSPPNKTRAIPSWLGSLAVAMHHNGNASSAILFSANRLGSDTDTLAAVSGTLCASRDGGKSLKSSWYSSVQDRDYIATTALGLADVARGRADHNPGIVHPSGAGLPELGVDISIPEAEPDDRISHSIFGDGTVMKYKERTLKGQDTPHVLVQVNFDCGQSCRFRVDIDPSEAEPVTA